MIKKDIKEVIKVLIKKNNPKLSPQSLNTYAQVLFRLYYNIHDNNEPFEFSFFEQQSNVLKELENYNPRVRKTYLSALISASPQHNDLYKKLMKLDIEEYDKQVETGEKTHSEEYNWLTSDYIEKKYNELIERYAYLLNKKKITMKYLQLLQDLIIVALCTGIYPELPPRRALDWTEFKILNIDDKKDNYIIDDTLKFNRFKTKKFYGESSIKIGDELKLLLNKFISLNPYEYLLVNSKGEKLNEITLNQKIKKIFDGKGGINIFRKVYITNLYSNLPNLKEIAGKMGHSVDQQMLYIKK